MNELEQAIAIHEGHNVDYVEISLATAKAILATRQSDAALEEALRGCHTIQSGLDGHGGMRVVAYFREAPQEWPLFVLLSTALDALAVRAAPRDQEQG